VETTSLLNGESVDSRCYSALKQMLDDCQAKSGGIPIVCSSYRPHDKQVRLFKEQVAKNMKEGMTREEAEKEAGTVVAVPGTSEHEMGLAVDICDSENQLLDESQANTDTQKWLMDNCWDYGFILRYPVSKSEITGIIYEPWHYRYVGVEAAKEIQARGICLEEYLAE
jgi:D-alanyl-D-alanine carboxypeptidase